MKNIRFIVCFMLVTICLNSFQIAEASNIKEVEQGLKELQQKSSEAQSNLNQIRSEKRNISEELSVKEAELSEVTEVLNGITFELEKKYSELNDTEEELEKTQMARDRQFNSFKERARYIYMNGSMSYLDVILKSKNITDLIKRVDYVNRIVEYDKNLINTLKESEIAIAEQIVRIEEQKDELEVLEILNTEKMHQYEETVAQMGAYIKELEQDEIANLQLLEQLDAASKEAERKIKEYEEEERRKAEAAAKAAAAAAAARAKQQTQTQTSSNSTQAATYTYDGAPLQWPVPSRSMISSGYVNRTNPVTGRKEFHSGIDIPAPFGSNIVAAEKGTVIHAGWMNGYGNTVIINHGGGMTTLYAHNSSLTVKVGQSVTRGQTIAKCGSTGISTGNHCHFEVRINGSHKNPLNYLKR